MNKTDLFGRMTVAGVVQVGRTLRGYGTKPDYTTPATDAILEDLAPPRVSRYRFSLSLLRIAVGLLALIRVLAASPHGN